MAQIAQSGTTSMFGFLVAGRCLTEGDSIEVRAPHDGSLVGTIFRATAEHVGAAIRASVRAFRETRRMASCEPQRVLRAVAAGCTIVHKPAPQTPPPLRQPRRVLQRTQRAGQSKSSEPQPGRSLLVSLKGTTPVIHETARTPRRPRRASM